MQKENDIVFSINWAHFEAKGAVGGLHIFGMYMHHLGTAKPTIIKNSYTIPTQFSRDCRQET